MGQLSVKAVRCIQKYLIASGIDTLRDLCDTVIQQDYKIEAQQKEIEQFKQRWQFGCEFECEGPDNLHRHEADRLKQEIEQLQKQNETMRKALEKISNITNMKAWSDIQDVLLLANETLHIVADDSKKYDSTQNNIKEDKLYPQEIGQAEKENKPLNVDDELATVKKHTKDCNWTTFCEGTKLEMEILPHPDEPALWIQMTNEQGSTLEGMYMSANFCPQCGADLRKISDGKC